MPFPRVNKFLLPDTVHIEKMTYVVDASGGRVPIQSEVIGPYSASILVRSSNEDIVNDRAGAEITYTAYIQADVDVSPRDRILWDGRALTVMASANTGGENILALVCTESR